MKKLTILLTLSLFCFYGCNDDEVLTIDSPEVNAKNENSKGIIHHVSVGGNDACEAFGEQPGCDKSYSLVANMHADGSVTGQLQDGFAGDYGGIHVKINCMIFVDDHTVIVGGIITRGFWLGNDLTGIEAFASVRDNGTSNNDTPDQISFTGFWPGYDCDFLAANIEEIYPESEYYDLTKGQVKIW